MEKKPNFSLNDFLNKIIELMSAIIDLLNRLNKSEPKQETTKITEKKDKNNNIVSISQVKNGFLSEHFTEKEFTDSPTAKEKGINNNFTSETQRNNARNLCKNWLEVIRKQSNSPIIISSGFRSQKLNKVIGGSSTSDHLNGLAVDFHAVNMKLADLFDLIIAISKKGIIPKFDQLIWENTWIHLGIGPRCRMQILKYSKGEYIPITKAPR